MRRLIVGTVATVSVALASPAGAATIPDQHDVIFSPNTQPAPQQISENVNHDYDVAGGMVRYDDDPGNGPDSPWSAIVAAHGDEVVSRIVVSVGFSGGANLAALLRGLTVNGDTFCFALRRPPPVRQERPVPQARQVRRAVPVSRQAGRRSRSAPCDSTARTGR